MTERRWSSFSGSGLVLFDFAGTAPRLQLKCGQRVRVVERLANDWYRGALETWQGTSGALGIFPCCVVQLDSTRSMHSSDPVIADLVSTLRTWGEVYRAEYVAGRKEHATQIVEQLSTLLSLYSKVTEPSFSEGIRAQLKEKIPARLDRARAALGFALTVKTEGGDEATHYNTPFHELYAMHARVESLAKSKSGSKGGAASSSKKSGSMSSSKKPSLSSSASDLRLVGALQSSIRQSQSLALSGNSSLRLRSSVALASVQNSPMLSRHHSSGVEAEAKSPVCSIVVRFPVCQVSLGGDPGDMFVSLYSRKQRRFLSEEFMIEINPVGQPKAEPVGVFRQVYTRELNAELFLMIRVVRRGNILQGIKKESNVTRRLFAAGLHRLNLRELQEKESTFKVRLNGVAAPTARKGEEGWMMMLEPLLADMESEALPLQCNLQAVSRIHFEEVEGRGVRVERLSFLPEFVLNTDAPRSDLFLWLEFADMPDRKPRNIEVTVLLVDARGAPLTKCLRSGAGASLGAAWDCSVVYHNNKPAWNEPFTVALLGVPEGSLEGLTAAFVLRHKPTGQQIPGQAFAHGALELSKRDGPFLSDMTHEVKCVRAKGELADYGSIPLNVPRERLAGTLKVRSTLVSNQVTNDAAVYRIMRWRTQTASVLSMLEGLSHVPKLELKKFLQPVLDSVVSIACDRSVPEDASSAACGTLVSVLAGLLDDRVGNGDRAVLDAYLASGSAARTQGDVPLWERMAAYVSALCNDPQPKATMTLMKGFEYVLRLMIYSYDASGAEVGAEVFADACAAVLQKVWGIASLTDGTLYAAQVVMLKNMGTWLIVMKELFDTPQCAELIMSFLKFIPYDVSKKNKNVAKLQLSMQAFEVLLPDIMAHPDGLRMGNFVSELLRTLPQHFRSQEDEELQVASQLLSKVLHLVGAEGSEGPEWDLFPLVPALVPLVSGSRTRLDCAINMCQLMWISRSVSPSYAEYLVAVLRAWVVTLPFPASWFSLNMFLLSCVTHVTRLMLQALPTDVGTFLALLVRFRALPVLDLSRYVASKREFVLANYGDLRVLLGNVWNDAYASLSAEARQAVLENADTQLIKYLFLLQLRAGEKEWAMRTYFTLLDDEYKATGALQGTESQTMDAFSAISNEPNAAKFQEDFFRELKAKLTSHSAPEARREEFLDGLQRLLRLQQQLRDLPDLPPYEHERASATLNIMAFLKRLGKTDIYRQQLQDLCVFNRKLGNNVEAGMGLLMAAGLIEWEGQKAQGPKEDILMDAVQMFVAGGYYEKGVEVLRELQVRYETEFFAFPRLADLYQQEADLLVRMSAPRTQFQVNYFRVAHYGGGWEKELRSVAYVIKGNPLEQLPVFRERLMSRYAEVRVLEHTDDPEEELLRDPAAKCLQIFTVSPESKADASLPSAVAAYMENVRASVFAYRKPFKKSKTGNPFRDLWSRVRFYTVEEAFPSIVRRSRISEVREVEVSPIENAVEAMRQKNKELRAMCTVYANPATAPADINPITQGIQGVVQAFVNGGTEEYINVFFKDPSFLQEYPQFKALAGELRDLLLEQDEILKVALAVYAKVVSDDFRPLQVEFEKTFAQMQQAPKEWKELNF